MGNWCRLFGIMAGEAPVCVLLRRGPSKWVQLLRWNTRADTFEAGHWFHGRIYERRCHVSPDGEHFIYFASKITARQLAKKDYTEAWTAISRPPRFKAEALWPKGDCWHGGGIFLSNSEVLLNHRPDRAVPHPNHLPKGFKVIPNPQAHGEDSPIYERILEHDGWTCIQEGEFDYVWEIGMVTHKTEVHQKRSKTGLTLGLELKGFERHRYGGNRVDEFSVGFEGGRFNVLEDVPWAELDQKGRLVFARHGKVYRAEVRANRIDETELIDLDPNHPPQLDGGAAGSV